MTGWRPAKSAGSWVPRDSAGRFGLPQRGVAAAGTTTGGGVRAAGAAASAGDDREGTGPGGLPQAGGAGAWMRGGAFGVSKGAAARLLRLGDAGVGVAVPGFDLAQHALGDQDAGIGALHVQPSADVVQQALAGAGQRYLADELAIHQQRSNHIVALAFTAAGAVSRMVTAADTGVSWVLPSGQS